VDFHRVISVYILYNEIDAKLFSPILYFVFSGMLKIVRSIFNPLTWQGIDYKTAEEETTVSKHVAM